MPRLQPSSFIVVGDDTSENRLDRMLADRFPDQSRTFFQKLIRQNRVLLNGRTAVKRQIVCAGDRLQIFWPQRTPNTDLDVDCGVELEIIHEDNDILVINKPAGLTVHAGAGNETQTVVNALLHLDYPRFSVMMDEDRRPGIVHRLDRETSGLMVIAKNRVSRDALIGLFKSKNVGKEYLALAHGCPEPVHGFVDRLIARHPVNRKRMTVVGSGGKQALTEYRVMKSGRMCSLLSARPKTGRTHQIRVHLSHLGHPLLGDKIYGGRSRHRIPLAGRHMLHAWRLEFPHPASNDCMSFKVDPPSDFVAAGLEVNIDVLAAIAHQD